MFHSAKALLLGGALLIGVAACGSDDTSSSTATTATAASTPASTTATTAPASSAPATTAATDASTASSESIPAGSAPDASSPDADGPSRIVSLSASATEMLYAIGAGDQVIALDDQSNFPEEALAKQTDLSGFTPNVEAIAGYEPDLVLIDGSVADLEAQLEELGVEVWVGPAPQSIDEIYTQIEQLGVATGHTAEAAELVGQMQTDIDAATSSLPDFEEAPSYYHELDPTFYSVTSGTFIGSVYQLFGLENIADTAEAASLYPQLSAEFVISQDPDLIFLADTKCCEQSAATVAARDGWDAISAVRGGHVIELDDDVASRWGPRIVDLVEAIAASIDDLAAVPAG